MVGTSDTSWIESYCIKGRAAGSMWRGHSVWPRRDSSVCMESGDFQTHKLKHMLPAVRGGTCFSLCVISPASAALKSRTAALRNLLLHPSADQRDAFPVNHRAPQFGHHHFRCHG